METRKKTVTEILIDKVAQAKDEGRKMSPLAEMIYNKYVENKNKEK